jgi:predicted nuclease with TOPRIM domain
MDKVAGFFKNKYVIGFGLGVATAIIGYRAYKSKKVRNAVVKAVACGMKLRDDARYTVNAIKEDAEDLRAETKEGNGEAGAQQGADA